MFDVFDPLARRDAAERPQCLQFKHIAIGKSLKGTAKIRIHRSGVGVVCLQEHLSIQKIRAPRSGIEMPQFLRRWQRSRSSRKLDDVRTEHTLTWTQPDGGLVVRCVGIEYDDFPAVEWTVYFQNNGPTDSPILENIQALDGNWQRERRGCSQTSVAGMGSPAYTYVPYFFPVRTCATRRWRTASARISSAPTLSSQPRQASVIDWP